MSVYRAQKTTAYSTWVIMETPSELRLRWMAYMRMHFESRWEQSPRILNGCQRKL